MHRAFDSLLSPFIVVTLAVVAMSSAMGCSEGSTPPPSEPAAESATPPPAPPREGPTEVQLVAWMEAHYSATILAHDALQQGDLAAFSDQLAEASTLAPPPAMPEPWAPLLARFKSAAGGAGDVASLDDAAGALADVVVTCGQCHVALGTGPVYPAPAPDDAINEFQAAMFDHKWATERLWEGVTGPWDVAWERGAAALAETRVFGDALGELEGDLLRREQALQALGQEAQRATDHGEKAAIYGRLLATCGDCHRAAGIEFDAEP